MAEIEYMRLPGKFDYGHHKAFTAASSALLADDSVKNVILDFTWVEYLDSSALGMMVLAKKKFKEKNKLIKITGAHGSTKEILIMANMNKIFEFI